MGQKTDYGRANCLGFDMAGGRKKLKKAMSAVLSGKQDKDILVPALLGAYRSGVETIVVAGRPDFVWVRLRGSQSELVQAFNEKVGFHFDLPILVLRDEDFSDRWIVHGRDIGQYESWEGSAYGVAHASSHTFAGASRTGSDIVWTNKRQYMPLLPRPVASGTMSIWMESDFYYFDGRYRWWPGSGTADLSGFRPTGAMNARYVTVYIDANGNPAGLAGPEFNKVYPGDPADYISIPDPDDGVVIAAVLFMTGTQSIGWGEIFDLRNPNQPPSPTGSPIWIADESAVLGKVWGLNFVGGSFEAVISGSYAHIIHTSDSETQRFVTDIPIALDTITGTYWVVPDYLYTSGSLALSLNGLVQSPTIHYLEQYPGSGTFNFIGEGPPTGSYLVVWYGVPAS